MSKTHMAKERIDLLLDSNSFVEVGGNITARNTDFNLASKKEKSDGVICGYGTIEGCLAFVYSQDAAVLNGTIGEMHAKKITGVYEMAKKMGAPVIGLIDCAGVRLEESVDALAALGSIYRASALLSGTVPQYIGIFGSCGGGLSFIPAEADFVFMEETSGRLFLNSPDAIPGNNREKVDNTTAKYQMKQGNVDFIGTSDEIIASMRAMIGMLPANCDDEGFNSDCQDDLNRLNNGIEGYAENADGLLYEISDDHVVLECGKGYGKALTTAFIKLNGQTVGAVVTDAVRKGGCTVNVGTCELGKLTTKSVRKAAKFINFCDAFNIPVLTIANIAGFSLSLASEENLGKAAARLLYAYANATVPKVTLNIGTSYGSAAVLLGSKSCGADLVYAWEDAKIGVMEGAAAARIICPEGGKDKLAQVAAEFNEKCQSAEAAAARGFVDTIIRPYETRKYLIGAFEMLYSKREELQDKKHGTI